MMHNWDGGWGAGGWLLMGFGMLLFWALVVAGVMWLVRYTAAGQRTRELQLGTKDAAHSR